MSNQFIIKLSDAELKALSVICIDPNEWIQNAVHFRCSTAIDEIVNSEVQRLLSEGKPITGSKDDIVLAADVETGFDRHARVQEEYRKLQEQQG